MLRFWTVMVRGTNGGTGYQHSTLQEAKQEADRIAHLLGNQGREVFVMMVVGYCEVPETPTTWHEINEENN